VAETLASPEIGREACARFVRTFVRPKGIDVPTTPIIVEAIEQLASQARARVRVPIALYPLSVVLWVGGVVAYYPQRIWNLLRKQWRIAEKKTHHMRKRLRRIQVSRLESGEGPDASRSSTNSGRPERSVEGRRKAG
jgi:hypothetical protein